MKKRVILVHGWEGDPQSHWFPWLTNELNNRDFDVISPVMPNSEVSNFDEWISALMEVTPVLNEETYFVGHSIGCLAIIHFLQKNNKKIGGAVFVAGYFDLTDVVIGREREVTEPWLQLPINFEMVRATSNKFITILSDNDEDVPLDITKEKFEKKLHAKVIVEHNKGHFTEGDGVTELPSVLESILEISQL
ncbi:hypothetical protein COB64_00150 [Candidatus Wolfebacteria bacterium]|nr:MAG: hypothetical protein COB64_00150 [Candidatus Wolfebacteria bacterium]